MINANKGGFDVNVGHMWSEVDRTRLRMEDIFALHAQGVVRPQIAKTFSFDEAPAAHAYMQGRQTIGKILPTP